VKHRRVVFHSATPRLSRAQRRWAWGTLLALWLTGTAWLVFHYGFVQHGEFGDLPHPLEGWSLRLHGAAGFATLWTLGLLWGVHVTRAWPTGRRRRTGITLISGAALLVLTGYLLYYGGESVRDVAVPLHWGLGLASLPLAVWHMRRHFHRAKTPRPATPEQ
jgi:hypothetical protein